MKAMQIAAEICIYTNNNITLEELDFSEESSEEAKESPKQAKGRKKGLKD